jgi:hypothetical protein
MSEQYRSYTEKAKLFAATLYDGREGEDDPLPHAMMITDDGEVSMFAIDGAFMASAISKSFMVAAIAHDVEKHKPAFFAWLIPIWAIQGHPSDEPPAPDFSKDPRRREYIQVMTFSPEQAEVWIAEIKRDPVRLEPWNADNGGKAETKFDGRFADPIIESISRSS